MMSKTHPMYTWRKPDLHDKREGSHLLVWGDLAQWLVVDDELAGFLKLFDGRRTLEEALRLHARAVEKSVETVRDESQNVIKDLLQRGVLHGGRSVRAIEPEPIGIANVTVNLTNRCNLHCAWCYNAERATEEMAVGALMAGIEAGTDILAPGASFIILGGEPFIDPARLFAAIDSAARIFTPSTLVSTNGTLLTDEVVAQLAERRVEVQVSLDAANAREHNTVRGEGVFERAVEGIRKLVVANVHTLVSMVYTRTSTGGIESLLDFALKLGVNEARLIPMRAIGRGLDCLERLPNQREVFEMLLDILQRRSELRPLLGRDFFSILAAVCRHSTPRTCCGIGRKVVFVDADGKVYPCPNHVAPRYECGNLTTQNLGEIVRGSQVLRTLRDQYQVVNYTRCRSCPVRYWCAGDCRGEVVALTGDPLGASPHCENLQHVIRELLWLLARSDDRLAATSVHGEARLKANAFVT